MTVEEMINLLKNLPADARIISYNEGHGQTVDELGYAERDNTVIIY